MGRESTKTIKQNPKKMNKPKNKPGKCLTVHNNTVGLYKQVYFFFFFFFFLVHRNK